MNKKKYTLLEKAFAQEINASLNRWPIHLIQTKSKVAEQMVEEGYFAKITMFVSGATIEGYELTHFGRMTYCMSCDE